MAQNPFEPNTLIVSGGEEHPDGGYRSTYSKKILKFSCTDFDDCSWTILDQELKYPRSLHVSFIVDSSFKFNCTTV